VKKSRFTDSQIYGCIEAGLPVPEICQELSIRTATLYKWRAKFGGVDTIHDGAHEGAKK
jgi:putative transposase